MSIPHKGSISFDPGHPNWPIKGQWMTHVSCSGLPAFIAGLGERNLLDYLRLDIDPSFKGGSHRIRFEMMAAYSICRSDIPRFLTYLSENECAITYKEDTHGYDIDHEGRILDTWELDDGAC